jgi:hypothetical protein
MGGMRYACLAASLAGASLLVPAPGEAFAVDCRPQDPGTSRARADVVFDAVALSGPAVAGRLLSPARMQVLRYRKGGGPRTVAVTTGLRDELTGLSIGTEGEFIPEPGETWRIYGRLRGTPSRVRRGEAVPTSVCFGTRPIRQRGLTRPIRGSEVVSREAGGNSAWRATALRGPGGLLCAAYRRLDRGRGRVRYACDRARGPRSTVIDVLTDGAPRDGSTVVLAMGPRLRAVDVTGPDGARSVRAAGRGRIAMTVLAGYVAPSDIGLTLRFAAGGSRTWDFDADRRAHAEDPLGGERWTARTAERVGRLCAGFEQDPPRFARPPAFAGRATCRRRDVRFFYAVGVPLPTAADVEPRTALYGAADPSVRSVAVIGPDGRRELALARRGRAFVTVYAGLVSHRDLAVEVSFKDGSRAILAGRRSGSIGP